MSDEAQPKILIDRRLTSPDEIKRAVKDALDDRKMEELGEQLRNLATQMELGFNGVHTKQDQTNGKVLVNIAEIAKIKSKANYDRLIWYLLTASVVVITYLITKH